MKLFPYEKDKLISGSDVQARWQHDCEHCAFLGKYKEFDLYVCPQSSSPTVVARYDNEGEDYISGLEIAAYQAPLAAALDTAINAGILKLSNGLVER